MNKTGSDELIVIANPLWKIFVKMSLVVYNASR